MKKILFFLSTVVIQSVLHAGLATNSNSPTIYGPGKSLLLQNQLCLASDPSTCFSTSGGGNLTLGGFNDGGATNEGLFLDGTALSLEAADGSHPGAVSTAVQHFAGLKTFNDGLGTDGGDISLSNGFSVFGKLYFDSTAYIGKEFGVIALRHQDFQVPDGQLYAATIHGDHLDVDSQLNMFNNQITPHVPFTGNGLDFNKPIFMTGNHIFMGVNNGMGTGGGDLYMEGGQLNAANIVSTALIQGENFTTNSGKIDLNADGSVSAANNNFNIDVDGNTTARTVKADDGLFVGQADDSSGHIIQSNGTAAFTASGTNNYTIDAPATATCAFTDVGGGDIVNNGYSWAVRAYAFYYAPDGTLIYSSSYAQSNVLTDNGLGDSSYNVQCSWDAVTTPFVPNGYGVMILADDSDYLGYTANYDYWLDVTAQEGPPGTFMNQSDFQSAGARSDATLIPTSYDLPVPSIISSSDNYFNGNTYFASGHSPHKVTIPGTGGANGYDMLVPYNTIFGEPTKASLRFGYSYSDPFSGNTTYVNFESNTTTSGGTAFDLNANGTGSRMRLYGEGGVFFRVPGHDSAVSIEPTTGTLHVGNSDAFNGNVQLRQDGSVKLLSVNDSIADDVSIYLTDDSHVLQTTGGTSVLEWAGSNVSGAYYYFDSGNSFRLTGDGSGLSGIATAASPSFTGDIGVGGNLVTSGSAPAVSACGTSPTISGNDRAGKVTVGTGGLVSSCTVTFNAAYGAAPHCFLNDQSEIVSVKATTTTSALTISKTTPFAASSVIDYFCVQ